MTNYNNEDSHRYQQKQIIQCPNCKKSVTVDELCEYVNANPETKKQAIEQELELWGYVYDRNYLIQNVVFCLRCHKVSHFKDWDAPTNGVVAHLLLSGRRQGWITTIIGEHNQKLRVVIHKGKRGEK